MCIQSNSVGAAGFSYAAKHIRICSRVVFFAASCSGISSLPKNAASVVSRFCSNSPLSYLHMTNVFLPYILSDSGIDSAKVGLIVGWEALLELPMLAALIPLRKKFSLQTLLIAGGVLFAVTTMGQGMSHSLAALLLCGIFFGFANSLTFSCGFNYIYYIAPPELRATAHTLYTIAGAIGIMVGNACAGGLIARVGTRPFYTIFAVLTVAVAALYALSFPFGKRVLKKELPRY